MAKQQIQRCQLGDAQFAAQFDRACRQIGFVAVTGVQGIRAQGNARPIEALKGDVYRQFDAFIHQPADVRTKYSVDASGQRGYVHLANEAESLGLPYRELRRHIMLGRQLPAGHPMEQYRPDYFQPNGVITEVPGLISDVEQLLDMLQVVTLRTFVNVEQHLGLPFGALTAHLACGQSFARLHLYPKLDAVTSARVLNNQRWTDAAAAAFNDIEVVDGTFEGQSVQNVLRAGPHTDVGSWTWLLGSSVGGLKVQARDGSVISFTTDPETLVANVCDFTALQIGPDATHEQGWYPSHHWVGMTEATAQKDRPSIANFVHPRPRAALPLANGQYGAEAAAALNLRLQEIGYLTSVQCDAANARLVQLPTDAQIISQTLLWEADALRRGAIAVGELSQFYALTNPKSGAFERRTAAEGPLSAYGAA